ncbi:uncharacterized protein LOC110102200 [Dendrobium catenatum]|uniref:uncharacterized protein LOC110102200 n=1 Tax=Dendrobium catenatum TaxID=906689 RepID=UPI00109EF2ED|nr:uncharacterized protein LOC110102200 [Dendrobium catenatum]
MSSLLVLWRPRSQILLERILTALLKGLGVLASSDHWFFCGILVLWNMKLVSFMVKDTSSQAIIGDLLIPTLGTWRIATIYGSRTCVDRGKLWKQLEDWMEDSTPSIIGVDYNCILSKEDKRGGKRFLFSKGPKEMKSFMVNYDFHDIGYIGPRFTWCNNKEGTSRIWERLDRCLLNSSAIQKVPLAITKHLARIASDHSPILLKLDTELRIKSKIIRFEDTWRSYPACKSIVNYAWKKKDVGNESEILQKKTNRTLKALFFWSRNKCKNLNNLKEKLKEEIEELQKKEALGEDWNEEDLKLLRFKVHEFNVTLRRLSTWWNQRAKAIWHEEGDMNSKLFHNFATAQCKLTDWPTVLQNQKIMVDDNSMLNEAFTVEDLKSSVFQQVNNFFLTGRMCREWKDTLIILIAKIKNPLVPANFRPISLCQMNYKIIASMLVNRLKKIISRLVSEEQMAFIPGRSISEHCLLAQEMFHKFKVSKHKKGAMAIKLDMEQAYDSMGWATLHHTLIWYGFPNYFSNLLLECVTEVRFSISINRSNSNWIKAYSGFRQGCPLSPYLFILCSQLLSNAINQRGQNLGIQISSGGPRITHLLYADDVLIFSHATSSLAKLMKKIVEDFCNWSGQRVNLNKSQILFGKNVRKKMRKKIINLLGIKMAKEMIYLGVKMALRRLKIADFQELIGNVLDRLNAWSRKSLSLGGKIVLIESSLLSMPNYLITNSLIPKRVLLELEKLCRNFIWHKQNGDRGIHYVAWDEICKPKKFGGLGLHSPLSRIGSLRSNVAWNFLQKPDSLFHKTMKHKYGDDILHEAHRKTGSSAWHILLDGGKALKNIARWNIGNGKSINVLNDTWLHDKCLNRWPTFINCVYLENATISEFLLNNGDWNYFKLQIAFHQEIIEIISQISIDIEVHDNIELINWCSGKTVSALSFESIVSNRLSDDEYGFFNWLMKLKLNKKVETFWWRLGKKGIPTNVFFKNRKISDFINCARGCDSIESYEHIMVNCKYLIEVIMRIREWGIQIPFFNSLDDCFHSLKALTVQNSGMVKLYCTIVYLSWKNRNEIQHQKTAIPSSLVAANALYLATSNVNPFLVSWGTNLPRESLHPWCPPPKDWIKINVDASLLESNQTGIGGIFRDHMGRFISAFGKKRTHWNIAQLELDAVFAAKDFLCDWMLECKGIIVESDNMVNTAVFKNTGGFLAVLKPPLTTFRRLTPPVITEFCTGDVPAVEPPVILPKANQRSLH